jgi:6-phosphogluconolactonase
MKIYTANSPEELAKAAADFIAAQLKEVGDGRPVSLAVSGGSTPALMLAELAQLEIDWSKTLIGQADERVAPDGDANRNLTQLQESLLDAIELPPANLLSMPVTQPDLAMAATSYAATIQATLPEGCFDIVHLGLGDDGHAASLVPGDPVLEVSDRDVWYTNEYKGRRRLTLTYPSLDRAGLILWLVAGANKAGMLKRLVGQDATIPAGRISQENAVVFADAAAVAELPPGSLTTTD